MAVPEQTPYSEHTGNGITKSFALNFDCESKDYLIVLVDEIEPPIATWSLIGGNVVFTTAPISGSKITIQRNTPFSRSVDYQSFNNSFRPQSVNGDFDRVWWKLQELGVGDWLLKLYVDRLHQQQEAKINDLKSYVDDRDDELRSYLMEEIRKQGVALDQLDEYYNYLMQRLAQIAVDKGWDASFVVDGTQTQKEINLYGAKAYDMPTGGYPSNSRVLLDNGDIVKSIIPGNTNDPNLNRIGWINTDLPMNSILNYGAIADGQPHKLSEFFTTLAGAQFAFPNAKITSLDQSLDYAALAQAIHVLNVRGGGTLHARNLALVATDTNLLTNQEQQGQRIDMKSNVIIDFTGSTLKDFIPIFLNCDDAWIVGGKFVDTASTAQILKRYAFTIRSSKRCGFKNGTTFYRTPGLGNNSVGYLYSYMLPDGSGGWKEGTGDLERYNEDIVFDKIMIYGYGQIQQIGGYNTIYDGVIYKQGVGDDGICFKTYMYDDGKGSGPIVGATLTSCWAEGAGSLFSIGGAVHTNFPISNITCVGGGGTDLQSLALIRSCGDTIENPSANSYGGTVTDINITGCTISGLNTRAIVAFWLSHRGVVKNINVSNITATMRTATYLGSRKGAYMMQLLDRHGTANSTLDNVKFNDVQLSSGHETIYKNKVSTTYGLGGLIDQVSNIGTVKNVRFDDISLDGCHVNGSDFIVAADQNVSCGRVFIKLENGASTLASSYKFIGRNMPVDKMVLDSNGIGRIALTSLVGYAYAGANYFLTKTFTVQIPLTEADGSFDFVMPAPENMYLLRAKARMVSALAANSSNYLTLRLHTNPLAGSYVDIFKTDVNTLNINGATVFTDNVQTYNHGNIWTFKQGDLIRLQGIVTGTVAQQKGLVIVFEYLAVDYR